MEENKMQPKYHITEDQLFNLCVEFHNYFVEDEGFSRGDQYRFLENHLEDLKEEE